MSDQPDEYQPHLPQHLVDETERRKALVKARIAANQKAAFWQRMLGEPIGRREFWAIMEETGALNTEFKYSPDGAISMEVTWTAFGKARYMWSVYRSLFAMATDQIVLMHKENDPDFQPEPKRRETDSEDE